MGIPDVTPRPRPSTRVQGVSLPHTDATLDFRGSDKTAVDFSGITTIFVPGILDIRAYGAVDNDTATAQGLSDAAKRDLNNTALQTAVTEASAASRWSRRVVIPGSYTEIFEFDETVLLDSGATLTSQYEGVGGPRLHYYGAVDTNAFEPTATSRSQITFSGIRLEDKRGSAVATGTGNGLHLESVYNGVILESCFIVGFYDNVYWYHGDLLHIRDGWLTSARHACLSIDEPANSSVIEGVAFDADANNYPEQIAAILIDGGGLDSLVTINGCKVEGAPNGSAAVISLIGLTPTVQIDGFACRAGSSNPWLDVIRVENSQASGIGQELSLRNVTCKAAAATNLLKVIHTNPEPDVTYVLPAHATQASSIVEWTSGHRVLSRYARPTWTQAASGSTPGTVVPGAGAGTGPTITLDGDDQSGSITVLTGTSPSTNSQLCSLYFHVLWPSGVRSVQLTPANATTSALSGAKAVYPGDLAAGRLGTGHMRLYTGATALDATTTYKWHYRVEP